MKNLQDTGVYLEEKARFHKNISIIFLAISGIVLLISWISNFTLIFIFVIPLLIGGFFLNFYFNYKKGSRGEQITIKSLQDLPDSYSLINDVNLPNGYGNIDHVILGSNGIFVIETKNVEGEIICNGDDWIRHYEGGSKVSSKGETYYQEDREYELKSPSKQVKNNALKLKQYIDSKNIFDQSLRLWVEGIVVFTHHNVILHCDNQTVPVLKANELCNFIRNKESKVKFSSQELEKVAKVLLRQNVG